MRTPTWEEIVFMALTALGGTAHLSSLYDEVGRIREARGLPLSNTWQDTVRRVVQQSKRIFSVKKRSGIWTRVPPTSSGHVNVS
jgi:hypothetical protein